MSDVKKVIVSAYPGYEELHDIAKPSLQFFAKKHNYDCRFYATNPTDLPASWSKVVHLIQAFEDGYDVAFWVDADAVIVNAEEDVPVPDTMHQGLARHIFADGNSAINCGIWYLRKEALPFLQEVWKTGPIADANPSWWEQNTVMHLLGISPFPPYTMPETPNNYLQKLFDLPYAWNICPLDKRSFNSYGQKFRILHAAGCGSTTRRADIMRRWVHQLGVDKQT